MFRRNLLSVSFADGSPFVIIFQSLGLCTVSVGDGKTYPRNPRADEMLNRLASELVSADKDR